MFAVTLLSSEWLLFSEEGSIIEEQEQFIPLIFPADKTTCNIYVVPNWQVSASVRYRIPLHNLKITFLCTVLLRLSSDQGCVHSSDFIICIKSIIVLLCFFCHHAPLDQSTLMALWPLRIYKFLNPEVSSEQMKGTSVCHFAAHFQLKTLHGWSWNSSWMSKEDLSISNCISPFKHNSQSFSPRKLTEEIVTIKTSKLKDAGCAFLDYPYPLYTKVCFNFKIKCKENNRSKRWVMVVDMDGRAFQDWLWSWPLKTLLVIKTQLQSEPFLIAVHASFLEFTVSLWSMKSCLRWRLNWIPYLTWYCSKKWKPALKCGGFYLLIYWLWSMWNECT